MSQLHINDLVPMHYKALEVLVYEPGAQCIIRAQKKEKRCVRHDMRLGIPTREREGPPSRLTAVAPVLWTSSPSSQARMLI
jgi:hypothetical protein